MAKNDYRRALIMLRGLERGYSGHARLEKRVMTGSMDIIAAAPEAEEVLSAAFVGKHGSQTRAQAIGLLKNDGRGQRALLATFDPRNIRGMDLSQVSVAVISRLEPDGARPVMYGYINGAKPLNWQKIREALDALYAPAQDAAAPVPPEPETPGSPEIPEAAQAPSPSQAERTEMPKQPPACTQAPKASETEASLSEAVSPAAAALPLDMSRPWPEEIDSLRILFLTLPAYEPFPLEGYVFVKAGMAEETNIDHCAVGIHAENGEIQSVCYAIPMPYTPQPPAGLEGYEWVGDTQSGWWMTVTPV